MNTVITKQKRILGGLYGSLVGDALGVPVEFLGRETLRANPVAGMRAYGTHHQPAGTWSDDGALLLCSAESLLQAGIDLEDMSRRFLRWYDHALWTATGTVFDIGNATRNAIDRISLGSPACLAGSRDPYSNGNGSLMRILPVAVAGHEMSDADMIPLVEQASCITHGHPRSQMACVFYSLVVRDLLAGAEFSSALQSSRRTFESRYSEDPELSVFRDVLSVDFCSVPENEIRSGGYVMETLTASLWALATTTCYADCVLKAVNLGSDSDTTGCVAGGLAGLLYGVDAIPRDWIDVLPRANELQHLCTQFSEKY